jgi:sialate O-acetylesterase
VGLAAIAQFVPSPIIAEVTPAPIFGDHMVLQRDKPVPVWGTAEPGEEVTVAFAEQTKTATADQDGNWKVVLQPMKASSEGRTLKIGAKEWVDVVVGEVWLTVGQSNMAWRLVDIDRDMAIPEDEPLLRLGMTAKYGGLWFTPQKGNQRDPHRTQATPYYTALELCRELKVPVAMVQTAFGGSVIEEWIPEADYRALQTDIPDIGEHGSATRGAPDGGSWYGHGWRSRVAPLCPMAMRGVLWYQGEFNERDGRLYTPKQRKLIEVLRREWNEKTLPFYFVQMPNGLAGIPGSKIENTITNPVPGRSDIRALFREAQQRCLDVPHTGMIVTIDLGDVDDGNHPRNKLDVGRRLCRLMLAKTYGRDDLVATGPLHKSHEIKEGKFIVQFDHVGKGLMVGRKPYKDGRSQPEPVEEVKGGTLRHFAICGEDRVWYWAEANIEGDTVVAWSDKVPNPVALRYAFFQWPTGANLYNRDGLPAAPFRTDDWERMQEGNPGPDQVVEWDDANLR